MKTVIKIQSAFRSFLAKKKLKITRDTKIKQLFGIYTFSVFLMTLLGITSKEVSKYYNCDENTLDARTSKIIF